MVTYYYMVMYMRLDFKTIYRFLYWYRYTVQAKNYGYVLLYGSIYMRLDLDSNIGFYNQII